MPAEERLHTHQKALQINLDATNYGSFAEIGAGQEVARWFLVVGGASGTVAKSISAYDKEVSDDLYGVGARYVSKERVEAMLDSEWSQLIKQLHKSREATTRFFSFVDTISARNYAGTNQPHGWLGLRFQLQPGGPPSEIVLHINLEDPSNPLEQEAIGILGVNLIHTVFFQLQTKDGFLGNVAQDIEKRIEIDYVEVRGPAFEGWDQREMLIELVRARLAQAVYFPASRPYAPPMDVIHKQGVVLAPGSFDHFDHDHSVMHEEMLASGIEQLHGELDKADPAPIGFFCFSAMALVDGDPPPTASDLIERIEALHKCGGDVLVFQERELYCMTDFVNRYTKASVRFVMGLSLLVRVWEYRYTKLAGTLFEALSRLLTRNVRIYAYPMRSTDLKESMQEVSALGWTWTDTNGWISALQLRPEMPLAHLYDYVLASNFLVPMGIPAALTAQDSVANEKGSGASIS